MWAETASGVSAAAQSPTYEQKEKCYAEKERHALQLGTTKGNAMSQNQKRILMAILAIVAVMFVYPPFQIVRNNGVAFNMGYGWIFDSPKRGSIIANVNVPMLLIQWIGVLIVGGIAFFLAKSSPQEPLVSGSNTKSENPSYTQPMLGTKLEKLQSAKKLFFIALAIDIAVTVIVISSSVWALGVVKDIETGARTLDQSLANSIDFWGSFAMIMILTTIGVGLGLVNWLASCYQFAKGSLHATGFKQESWIGVGWILPIFNLFKPYQIINEIYRAGSPTYNSGDDWKKESGSSLILTWWIFWAVTHFLMVTIGKEMFKKTSLPDLTIPQVIEAYEVQAWSCAISIVIAGLWFVVANQLTRRLVVRSSRHVPLPKLSFSDSTKVTPISSGQPTTQSAQSVSQPSAVVRPPAITTGINEPTLNIGNVESSNKQELNMDNLEDWAYEKVSEELESNTPDKAVWTKAFAQSGGDDKQTRVIYIKLRVEKLIALEKSRLEVLRNSQEEIAFRKSHDEAARLRAAEQARKEDDPKKAERYGLLVCSVDRECEELGISSGDVIIFYNGIDVRNNMALFVQQLEGTNSSERSFIRLVRGKQFVDLTVRGGKLGLKVSQLV